MIDTHDFSGSLDRLPFFDQTIGAKEHDADLTGLEIHAHAFDARGKPGARANQRGEETRRMEM